MGTSEWQTPAARTLTRKPEGGVEGTGIVSLVWFGACAVFAPGVHCFWEG